jgi:hypothetical protein
MLNGVLAELRSSFPASATQASAALAGPVSVVHIASRWDGRAVYAVFPRGCRTPAAVLKMGTNERSQRQLRAEHAALERVAGVPTLSGRVPVSLGLFSTSAAVVLAQSGLPGVPLNVLLRRRLLPGSRSSSRDHALVTDWLAALRAHDASGAATVEVETVARRLDDALPRDLPRRREIIGRVTAVGRSLGPLRVPLVPVHGDLAPNNCLVAGGGLNVIDWEGALPEGDPLVEIVRFLNNYARRVPASRRRMPRRTAAFRRAFIEEGWLADVTYMTWRRQLAELQLPTEAADYLLVATLADFATGRATSAHARGPAARRYWSDLLAMFTTERRVTV